MLDTISIEISKKHTENIFNVLDSRSVNKENIRELIVAAFLSLSREHHRSIILLLEKGIYSSAFALLRPLIDAVYRGLWVSQVASDEEVSKIFNTEYKFNSKTYELIDEIDTHNNIDIFHKNYKKVSSFLHGMTHGGIEQLTRQFSRHGDFIDPNFSENDLVNLIMHINAHIAIFLIEYNSYQNDDELGILGHEILNIKKEDILYNRKKGAGS